MNLVKLSFVIVLLVFSCKKENLNQKSSNKIDNLSLESQNKKGSLAIFPNNDEKNLDLTYANVKNNGDMLEFETEEDYNLVMEKLNNNATKYKQIFSSNFFKFDNSDIEKYSENELESLNNDLYEYANKIGYGEYDIYENFETTFKFKSLRSKLAQEESEFLNNSLTENLEHNPIYKYGGIYEFQTVLNLDGEVKVGEKIFKVYEDGIIVIIENGELDILNKIRDDRNNAENLENVTIFNSELENSLKRSSRSCRYNVDKKTTLGISSTKKSVALYSFWFDGSIFREINRVTNYIKNSSGIWIKTYRSCWINDGTRPSVQTVSKWRDCSYMGFGTAFHRITIAKEIDVTRNIRRRDFGFDLSISKGAYFLFWANGASVSYKEASIDW